jgi:hypothetical protein
MQTFQSGLRTACIAVLIGAGSLFSSAAEPQHADPADVINLPKFEVTADRILPPLEKWHYVSIPGYEILSNVSVGTTRRFVKDFYLLQQVGRILLPNTETKHGLPTYVVLCGRGNAFDHFMPRDQMTDHDARGLYFSDSERTAIVVDFSPGADDEGETSYQAFYGSYFRTIIQRELSSNTPPWMEEGLVRLFSTVDFTTGWIEFGKVTLPGFGFGTGRPMGSGLASRSAIQSSQRAISSGSITSSARVGGGTYGRPLIPLNDFFALKPGAMGKYSYADFSNQAYLFTHMCLYGQRQKQQRGYYQLVQRAMQGPITEEIFKECFGQKVSSFGASMRGYSQSGSYRMMVDTAENGLRLTPSPEFEVRTGTDAESGRIAGEVLRLAGRRNDALNRLIAPYVRGDRSPDLLAALGLAEAWAGRPERARKFLEAAVAAKTTRPRAYAELGRLRFEEVKTRAETENRPLSDQDCRFVLEALEAGVRYPPALDELYNNLAMVWVENPTRPTPAQYAALISCVRQNPKNLMLTHNVAAAGIQHGYFKEGRLLVEHGLRYAATEKARAAFSKLNEHLAEKAPPATEVSPDSTLPDSPQSPKTTSQKTSSTSASPAQAGG